MSGVEHASGIFKRDLPRWLYVLLAAVSFAYSADHWIPPWIEQCAIESVKEVSVREGSGRGARRQNWSVVDLANGAGFEKPSGTGEFAAGDSLLVVLSPLFKVVRSFQRPGFTYWTEVGRSGDTQEMFLLVPIVGLLSLMLIWMGWTEDTRTILRVVLLLFLFIWGMYMLGIHGPRLLARL